MMKIKLLFQCIFKINRHFLDLSDFLGEVETFCFFIYFLLKNLFFPLLLFSSCFLSKILSTESYFYVIFTSTFSIFSLFSISFFSFFLSYSNYLFKFFIITSVCNTITLSKIAFSFKLSSPVLMASTIESEVPLSYSTVASM